MPADEAFRNDLPAGFAAVVVGIKTVLAEAGIFIGNAVLFPDRLTAVVAGDAVFLNTVIAEQLIVYRRALFLCKLSSAVVTNILTSSSISSSSKNKKIPVRLKDSPYRNYNIYLIFGVDTGKAYFSIALYNSSRLSISTCSRFCISVSTNSFFIFAINRKSKKRCATVVSKPPISSCFGLLVIHAAITLLDDAIMFDIRRIFLVRTSYSFLSSLLGSKKI